MGTRAIIEFADVRDERPGNGFLVYQHWDGDPVTVRTNVLAALPLAWPLPRFEADEFAAAYIAANKKREGGFRLVRYDVDTFDAVRWHRVYVEDGTLYVSSFACADGVITHPMGKRVAVVHTRVEQQPNVRHECDCGALWWTHAPGSQKCPTCGSPS